MNDLLRRWGPSLLPVALAFAVTVLLLLAVSAPPLEALELLWEGSFGSTDKIADTLMAWAPLTLAAAGLIYTFQAGLWNIGIEGQIILGSVGATWAAREIPGPGYVVIPAAVLAGVLGGVLWALIPAFLKVRLRVNEIFSGVALDFVAIGLIIYLIIGPWSRPGIASTSGTELFRDEAWFPRVGDTRLSLVAVALALAAVIVTYFVMRGTSYGLKLKAVGRSEQSAFLLGIPTRRFMVSAFVACGTIAGIAGAVQVLGFHHKLVPGVSGNYGFLGILVVLLAGFRAAWLAPLALFFAAISVGSTQLSLRLGIDSALAGVIQGTLVLFILLVGGWQATRRLGRDAAGGLAEAGES